MTLSYEALQKGVEVLQNGRAQPSEPIGNLPEGSAPCDLAQAMQLQKALNVQLSRRLGKVADTKIGCTTKVMQDYLGMSHPCTGAIFESTIHRMEGDLEFDSYLHVGVECEIAVELGTAIGPEDGPFTLESVASNVKSVHAAIEIVDDRYFDFVNRIPDWRTWVADDFFGAGAVLGEPVTDWQNLDLAGLRGVMRINGQEVGTGHGRDIINGHPLEALVWLANAQAECHDDIPAGWIVMLGSVVQTKWVSKGDIVEVELDGLGTATAMFR